MHALIIGATGATGRALLEQLLDDASVDRVTVFIRNKWVLYHKKLTAHVVDFNQLDSWKHLIVGDVLFSCLGTTRKAAGSKAGQWLVDYTYQAECARIASENQVSAYVLVSSVNASEASSFFYSRMKGQLETYIQTLSFAKVLVFRPPILIRKNSDRRLEVLSVSLLKTLNSIGLLRTQAPLATESLATAMIRSLQAHSVGFYLFNPTDIQKIISPIEE
ncbi:MAG TPA: NAD(P)H-binding protein [Bacteroidales bacterium]|nr:NAD(P)H-binding protein [Bacteroidales bacterium]